MSERNYITAPQAIPAGTARTVEIASVVPNPWNYNAQTPAVFRKLVESIRRFGYAQPVIVRALPSGQYEIVNGEHRWQAVKELGHTEIEVYDLGPLSDVRAKELCIILNKLHGSPDEIQLASLLREINLEVPVAEMEQVLPYSTKALDHYLNSVDFSFANLSTEDVVESAPVAEEFAVTVALTYPKATLEKVKARLAALDADPSQAVETLLTAWERSR